MSPPLAAPPARRVQVCLLLAPMAALVAAWLLSSLFAAAACAWVVLWWSWASVAELALCVLLDVDLAVLTLQAALGLGLALELGARCCRRGDGQPPPALLDTLHDRLLRESGSVFALLTLASLFSADGLGEMFSWHVRCHWSFTEVRAVAGVRRGESR